MKSREAEAAGWEVYPSVSLQVGEHLKEMASYESSLEPFIEVDVAAAEHILKQLQPKDAKPCAVNFAVESVLPKSQVLSDAFGYWNATPEGTAKRGAGNKLHTLKVGVVRPSIRLTKHPDYINNIVVHELKHVADYTSRSVSIIDNLYRVGLEFAAFGKFCLNSITSTIEENDAVLEASKQFKARKLAKSRPLERRAYATDAEKICSGRALISLSSTKHFEKELLSS